MLQINRNMIREANVYHDWLMDRYWTAQGQITALRNAV
jgi:hypothetical protein